ncbi:sensor histidine kinase [Desulfovibrio inopinatus]|uniref:sensor histidine kinase n=1 Tax=Desulfovibrio inopinatus TaxID=102109 RepID=UPI0003F7BDC3|nr:sensor histidine kinase [Desulfovibrio inopinatus]
MNRISTSRKERPQGEQYYKHLARNMSMNIIAVALAPMLLVTAIFIHQFHSAYKEKIHDHLKELVLKHQHEIETYLNQQLGLIRFLADIFTSEELSDPKFLSRILASLHREYGQQFVDLGFVDTEGKQVAYAGPFRLEEALYSGSKWFEQARGASTYISDVFLGLRGLPHFIVAVSKSTPHGKCILRATVDFNVFSRLVENIRVGETGFAYILNANNEFQTQMLPGTAGQSFVLPPVPTKFSSDIVTTKIVSDESGEEHIVVIVPLKNGAWRLVYQQSTKDAYMMLMRTRLVTVIVLILGTLGIVTTVIFLSRRMAARVARADYEKADMDKQMVEAGRLAAIGELAAGIAHEINNPVAIMVEEAGWMEDLLEDGVLFHEDPEEGLVEFMRALQQIRLQGQRCKEITHKLLHFARKSGQDTQRIAVDELVLQILSLVEQRARYNKVNIISQLHGNLPIVLGSSTELQQVVLNLINNAIDAIGREGGMIVVSTGNRKTPDDPMVFIQVADNGQGIPEANLSRIFDPFFTTKPVGQGTGLGLSICYGIVTRMGGDIEVQSRSEEGTVFTVLLPAAEIQHDDLNEPDQDQPALEATL